MSFLGVNGNTTVHNDSGSSSKENETTITPRNANANEDEDYVESSEDNEKSKKKSKKTSKKISKKISKSDGSAKNSDLFLDDQALEAKINSVPQNSNSFVVFLMSSS